MGSGHTGQGWAQVDELLEKISSEQYTWDIELLKEIVENNDKTSSLSKSL